MPRTDSSAAFTTAPSSALRDRSRIFKTTTCLSMGFPATGKGRALACVECTADRFRDAAAAHYRMLDSQKPPMQRPLSHPPDAPMHLVLVVPRLIALALAPEPG